MIDNFTDLALLVGTNPLPDYVVAKYFIKTNPNLKKIWLIHSETIEKQEGTEEFAENIRRVVTEEPDLRKPDFEFIALSNVGSALAIKKDLMDKFFCKLPMDVKMHLNYTGGTKSMAVHVYRNLEQNLKNHCSYSYLDARTYMLKSDESMTPLSNNLRDVVSISLDDLIKLHGYEKHEDETPFTTDNFDSIMNLFETLIKEDKLETVFLSWKNNFIRKVYYENDKFIVKPRDFLKHNNLLNVNGQIDESKINKLKDEFKEETPDEVKELLRLFPQNKSMLNDDGSLWIPDINESKNNYNKRIRGTIKDFLDGKWLESYVYRIIQDALTNDERLHEKSSKKNISIDSNWKIRKRGIINKDFELDVIVLNGYQVCGISCTTSDKQYICKEKAFEVLHRVKQIGGEEAKAILVGCLEKDVKDDFVKDILTVSGSRISDFIMLGIEDLKPEKLWQQIRKHIWEVD